MNQAPTRAKPLHYGMYILAMLIFGLNGYLAAHIHLTGSQVVLLRTLIGGTMLTLLVLFQGGFDRESVRSERKWLLLGGMLYTLGCLFYLWKRLPYHHPIWHLFVLAGSLCHFFCILWHVMA